MDPDSHRDIERVADHLTRSKTLSDQRRKFIRVVVVSSVLTAGVVSLVLGWFMDVEFQNRDAEDELTSCLMRQGNVEEAVQQQIRQQRSWRLDARAFEISSNFFEDAARARAADAASADNEVQAKISARASKNYQRGADRNQSLAREKRNLINEVDYYQVPDCTPGGPNVSERRDLIPFF